MHYLGRNHNTIAPAVYRDLEEVGIRQTSRNGPVIRMPRTTTIVSLCPRERVNFDGVRDANPFFHLVEAAAMLGNCNSVELLSFFAKNMRSFSDDGERYNAFYGERLRSTWGDQLAEVVAELADKPDSRQAVAQIWDPADLTKQTKDKACNLCLMFQVSPAGELEMTSVNRSNDAIWGILSGANTVHLSYFQEYVACALGLPVGAWTHFSNNLHVYTDPAYQGGMWDKLRKEEPAVDLYAEPANIQPAELMFAPGDRALFDAALADCLLAMNFGISVPGNLNPAIGLYHHVKSPFLKDVLAAYVAFVLRRRGSTADVVQGWVHKIAAPDWHLACHMWVQRRAGRAEKEVAS